MKILIFKAPCPVCRKVVFHAKEEDSPVQYFEVKEAKMMVIVATPEIDGVKRVALGPCQRQEPFYREGKEEPVIYFGHPRHGCQPPMTPGHANQLDTSTGTAINNSGQISAPSILPEVIPASSPPVSAPISEGRRNP